MITATGKVALQDDQKVSCGILWTFTGVLCSCHWEGILGTVLKLGIV